MLCYENNLEKILKALDDVQNNPGMYIRIHSEKDDRLVKGIIPQNKRSIYLVSHGKLSKVCFTLRHAVEYHDNTIKTHKKLRVQLTPVAGEFEYEFCTDLANC